MKMRHTRNINRKIHYHYIEEVGCIASVCKGVSAHFCERLLSKCESVGFHKNDGSAEYPQATTDIEIDSAPKLKSWLQHHNIVDIVSNCMSATHGLRPTAFDDMFIVKYDAENSDGQTELKEHFDAGDVTFMLALSRREAYRGGGTRFNVLLPGGLNGHTENTLGSSNMITNNGIDSNDSSGIIHLEQGDILVFDAGFYHKGMPITNGVRYLLVGFCYVDPEAANEKGNLSLNLDSI